MARCYAYFKLLTFNLIGFEQKCEMETTLLMEQDCVMHLIDGQIIENSLQ